MNTFMTIVSDSYLKMLRNFVEIRSFSILTNDNVIGKQEESARERALCQLTECF